MMDNLVSRSIGFAIRFVVIIAALVTTMVAMAVGIVMAALWPFLPLLIFYFAFRGIVG